MGVRITCCGRRCPCPCEGSRECMGVPITCCGRRCSCPCERSRESNRDSRKLPLVNPPTGSNNLVQGQRRKRDETDRLLEGNKPNSRARFQERSTCETSRQPPQPDVERHGQLQKPLNKLQKELRTGSEIITKGVKGKVTVEDTAVIRLENLDTDLMALEVNVDNHFAHSLAKRVVKEVAETMFVTLRNTKEMEEIGRRCDHQKIERGEDGELYGVEIHYIMSGQQNPSGTFYPLSGGRPSNPVMMIAYRILVKTLEGCPDDDIPDKTELEALEI